MTSSATEISKTISSAEIMYLISKGHRVSGSVPCGLESLRLQALLRGYALKANMAYEEFEDAISFHYASGGESPLPVTQFRRVA